MGSRLGKKGYLYYYVNTPIYYFFVFIIGYILGRVNKDFALSVYKLGMLLLMFLLLHVFTYLFMVPSLHKLREKYFEEKRRRRMLSRLK